LRPRCEQDSHHQYRSCRKSPSADYRTGPRHRRLRTGLRPECRDPRQQKGSHPLVCGLRRDGGEQRHHRPYRSHQRRPRAHPQLCCGEPQRLSLCRAHVEEIAGVVKKFSEPTVPAISRREAELSFDTWVTPNTAGKPLGWMSEKDWNETVAVLKQYGGG